MLLLCFCFVLFGGTTASCRHNHIYCKLEYGCPPAVYPALQARTCLGTTAFCTGPTPSIPLLGITVLDMLAPATKPWDLDSPVCTGVCSRVEENASFHLLSSWDDSKAIWLVLWSLKRLRGDGSSGLYSLTSLSSRTQYWMHGNLDLGPMWRTLRYSQ